MLRQAKLQGLSPLDYATESLQRQLRSREANTARFDAALTSAMVHYLADLRVGRSLGRERRPHRRQPRHGGRR